MNIEAVGETAIQWPVAPALQSGAQPQSLAFDQMMLDGISDVNQRLMTADRHLQDLATGKPEQIHDAMIHMEQARLSFQFMVQVRNRFLDAYQQLMQMQV